MLPSGCSESWQALLVAVVAGQRNDHDAVTVWAVDRVAEALPAAIAGRIVRSSVGVTVAVVNAK
jgi:hypothetical protein